MAWNEFAVVTLLTTCLVGAMTTLAMSLFEKVLFSEGVSHPIKTTGGDTSCHSSNMRWSYQIEYLFGTVSNTKSFATIVSNSKSQIPSKEKN
jgi:hypothetical protein